MSYDEHGFYKDEPDQPAVYWWRDGESLRCGDWEVKLITDFGMDTEREYKYWRVKNLRSGASDQTFRELWPAMEYVEQQI